MTVKLNKYVYVYIVGLYLKALYKLLVKNISALLKKVLLYKNIYAITLAGLKSSKQTGILILRTRV